MKVKGAGARGWGLLEDLHPRAAVRHWDIHQLIQPPLQIAPNMSQQCGSRVNMAHIRQSRPDFGLVKVLKTNSAVLSLLTGTEMYPSGGRLSSDQGSVVHPVALL